MAKSHRAVLRPKPDIDWQDPVARKAHLGDLVAAGRALWAEVAGLDDPAVTEPAALLAQVIGNDVEDGADGNPDIRQGVASDRTISHSDPEMRHGRASTATSSTSSATRTANRRRSPAGQRRRRQGGGPPARPGHDDARDHHRHPPGRHGLLRRRRAGGGGGTRRRTGGQGAAGDQRRALPQDRLRDQPRDEDSHLPGPGDTTDARAVKDHKGRPATRFDFDAATCGACPFRAQCTTATGGRQITVGTHELRIAAARAAQTEPETRALLRRRSNVECV